MNIESVKELHSRSHRGKFPEQNTNRLYSIIKLGPQKKKKIQSFFKANDTVNRTKQQPNNWEKMLPTLPPM